MKALKKKFVVTLSVIELCVHLIWDSFSNTFPVVKLNMYLIGKVSIKKNIKNYGIFHQNFTQPPFDEKKHFFVMSFMFIITKFGKNEFISASFKMFEPKSWSQKVRLPAVISALNPPVMKSSSLHFLDELDHSDHLCIFYEKNIFFSEKSYGNRVDPTPPPPQYRKFHNF